MAQAVEARRSRSWPLLMQSSWTVHAHDALRATRYLLVAYGLTSQSEIATVWTRRDTMHCCVSDRECCDAISLTKSMIIVGLRDFFNPSWSKDQLLLIPSSSKGV